MKVIYKSKLKGTFHPVLGWLPANEPIEMNDDTARLYIDAGLLEKAEKKSSKFKVQRSTLKNKT